MVPLTWKIPTKSLKAASETQVEAIITTAQSSLKINSTKSLESLSHPFILVLRAIYCTQVLLKSVLKQVCPNFQLFNAQNSKTQTMLDHTSENSRLDKCIST